jgi:Zn-dependent protease with chaperone function
LAQELTSAVVVGGITNWLLGHDSAVRGQVAGVFAGVVFLLGAVLVRDAAARDRGPRPNGGLSVAERWWAGAFGLVFGLLLVVVALLVPTASGIAFCLWLQAVAALAFATVRPVQVLRVVGLLRPDPARLYVVAHRLDRPVESVLEHRSPRPATFAFADGTIAFSTGAIELLDDAELLAIGRHEVAHLAEPRRRWMLRAAGLVVVIGVGPLRALTSASAWWLPVAYALLFVAFVVALRRQARRWAAEAEEAVGGYDGGKVYGAALEKLYRDAGIPASRAAGAHPSLYDRLLAAGIEPDYPRPRPPARTAALWGCARSLGLLATAVLLVDLIPG